MGNAQPSHLCELLLTAASRGHEKDVTKLLEKGLVPVDAAGVDGTTALMHAATSGHVRIARLLLENNAKINSTNHRRMTALMCSAQNGHEGVVRLLLDSNASVDSVDANGDTALIRATVKGSASIVNMLLEHGASVSTRNNYGKSALDYAKIQDRRDILQMIQSASASRPSKARVLTLPAWFISIDDVAYESEELENIRVRRGTWNHTDVVTKTRFLNEMKTQNSFIKEVGIWIELNHPHILKLHGACHVSSPPFFVFEYATQGNFKQYFDKGQNRHVFWQLFREVMSGMLYLAKEMIVHGNLKCSNLLVGADGKAKIADFGFIYSRSGSRALSKRSKVDSVRWKAPECIRGEVENPDFRSDMYSLGMCIIEAWTGDQPWGSNFAEADIINWTLEYKLPEQPAGMSDRKWELVKRMCHSNPKMRTSLTDAVDEVVAIEEEDSKVVCPDPECKTVVPVGSRFCPSCGYRIIATTMQHSQEKAVAPFETPDIVTTTSTPLDQLCAARSRATLDQVKLLCKTMHEAQTMCSHIYSRMFSLAKHLDFTPKATLHNQYESLLERFHDFLVQYGNKRTITRVASGRVIVSVCHRMHEELDELIKLCASDTLGDCLGWKDKFQTESKIQLGLLTSVLEQKHMWMDELQDAEAQAEALTLLLFELNHRAEKYEPDEVELIDQIFRNVVSYSTLGIPSVPTWFLPPHEVESRNQIARGAFGSVRLGSWNGTKVAVKALIFQDHVENRQMFLKEVDIWFSLQHPHIVRLFGACHVGNPFFVCELASNGNLSEYLFRPENRHKTWKCLHEAALGLSYLHTKRKIVHLDIKANNILVTEDGSAKLADFGLSCFISDLPPPDNATSVGAIQWKAPEYISGESSGSFACDVYSFGMTIIEAVTQNLPFGRIPDVTLKRRVTKEIHELPKQPEEMSDAQWDLITRMCSANPDDRIDMNSVVEELQSFAFEELSKHLEEEEILFELQHADGDL